MQRGRITKNAQTFRDAPLLQLATRLPRCLALDLPVPGLLPRVLWSIFLRLSAPTHSRACPRKRSSKSLLAQPKSRVSQIGVYPLRLIQIRHQTLSRYVDPFGLYVVSALTVQAKVQQFLRLKYERGQHINTTLLSSSSFANPHIYSKLVSRVLPDNGLSLCPG